MTRSVHRAMLRFQGERRVYDKQSDIKERREKSIDHEGYLVSYRANLAEVAARHTHGGCPGTPEKSTYGFQKSK